MFELNWWQGKQDAALLSDFEYTSLPSPLSNNYQKVYTL